MVLNTAEMDAISDREKFVTLALDGDETKPKIGYTRKNGNDKSNETFLGLMIAELALLMFRRIWLSFVINLLQRICPFLRPKFGCR